MYTLIFILVFLGFYLCYATSKRMVVANNFGFEEWCYHNNLASNIFGIFNMIIANIISMVFLGWGAGILSFAIVLMTVGSMVIILQPLRLLNYLSVATSLLFFFLFQYLFS